MARLASPTERRSLGAGPRVAWEWAKVIAATILQQLDEDWSKLVNKCLSCNSSNHFAKGCDDEEAKAAVAAAKMKKEVQQKIDSKKKKSNARANTAAAEESNGSSGCESDADSDGDFKLKGTGKGPKTEAKVQIENYYGTILKSSGVHNIICKLQIQALAEGMRCSMGFE